MNFNELLNFRRFRDGTAQKLLVLRGTVPGHFPEIGIQRGLRLEADLMSQLRNFLAGMVFQ